MVQSSFTRRTVTAERMDDPSASHEEIAEALRFIRLVNRRLGGTRAALGELVRWSGAWNSSTHQPIRILDVGTGSADIPLAIVQWARAAGHHVHITAVDLHPVTVELAREHVAGVPEIDVVQANALQLTDRFAPGTFHCAHAGMFLHHLDDVQVLTVLRMMDRLTAPFGSGAAGSQPNAAASGGVIWNDLLRNWAGRVGVRLACIGVPAIVKHDAIVSVEAGFTRSEALDIARRVGLRRVRFRTHLFHRFTLCADK
jgi:2-polyprenyl-3-methyl-5-hydroxy-6-metoxy-1,4-benzoquinol methylase